MKVSFWGVRGSIPAPGPETNRYGGNTSCVAIETREGRTLILDMGTGVAVLGKHLMGQSFGKGQGRASIILGHAHWDHIQGFPFFAPIFVPGNHFDFYGHSGAKTRLEDVLEGQMSPNFSPVQSLKNLGATIDFFALESSKPVNIEGLRVIALPVPHGATTSLALRIEEPIDPNSNEVSQQKPQEARESTSPKTFTSVIYVSDVGYPTEGIPKEIIQHYRGADLLIHDCTYSVEDHSARRNRGFSSIRDAAQAATQAKVKHLVMFHYDQDYSDEKVDTLKDSLRQELNSQGGKEILLTPAAEGLSLVV